VDGCRDSVITAYGGPTERELEQVNLASRWRIQGSQPAFIRAAAGQTIAQSGQIPFYFFKLQGFEMFVTNFLQF
jgi:hypothetical protein